MKKTDRELTKESICKQFFLTEDDYNNLVKITKSFIPYGTKKINIYSDTNIIPLYSIMSLSLLNYMIQVVLNDSDKDL